MVRGALAEVESGARGRLLDPDVPLVVAIGALEPQGLAHERVDLLAAGQPLQRERRLLRVPELGQLAEHIARHGGGRWARVVARQHGIAAAQGPQNLRAEQDEHTSTIAFAGATRGPQDYHHPQALDRPPVGNSAGAAGRPTASRRESIL